MTSEQLAAAVEQTIRAAKARVLGVGRRQYEISPDEQQFERMPADELLAWACEEAEDLIVYCIMARIQLTRIRRQLKRRGIR